MRVPKEVVPYLLEEVRTEIADALAEDQGPNGWDPNDIIIFDGFVQPVLEDALETGFTSTDMLDKGFGFMIALIPSLLERRGDDLSDLHYGMLAKLYHLHMIERALDRVKGLKDEWYRENLASVDQALEWARAIKPRT